jgi:hypothetical protein
LPLTPRLTPNRHRRPVGHAQCSELALAKPQLHKRCSCGHRAAQRQLAVVHWLRYPESPSMQARAQRAALHPSRL